MRALALTGAVALAVLSAATAYGPAAFVAAGLGAWALGDPIRGLLDG